MKKGFVYFLSLVFSTQSAFARICTAENQDLVKNNKEAIVRLNEVPVEAIEAQYDKVELIFPLLMMATALGAAGVFFYDLNNRVNKDNLRRLLKEEEIFQKQGLGQHLEELMEYNYKEAREIADEIVNNQSFLLKEKEQKTLAIYQSEVSTKLETRMKDEIAYINHMYERVKKLAKLPRFGENALKNLRKVEADLLKTLTSKKRSLMVVGTESFALESENSRYITKGVIRNLEERLSSINQMSYLSRENLEHLLKKGGNKVLKYALPLLFVPQILEGKEALQKGQDEQNLEKRLISSPYEFHFLSDEAKCVALDNPELKAMISTESLIIEDFLLQFSEEPIKTSETVIDNQRQETSTGQSFREVFKKSGTGR